MSTTTASHLELHLQQAIDRLRAKVVEMGTGAARAVRRAGAALQARDVNEASAVILRDRLLNQLEGEGERLGLELLVRHQPAGRTLRFVYASFRILRDLERVGDCAGSVARQTLSLMQADHPAILSRFGDQAALATDMLERAIRAYRDEDEALARQTIPIEESADQLREQIRQELLHRQRDGELSVNTLTSLLTVARRLERVTDEARNICEEVVFVCTGTLLRHVMPGTFRILFVDDSNACLGHLAEAVARRAGDSRFTFHSAGMHPVPPDPRTREFLQGKGEDVSALMSRSLGQVPAPEEHDLVVGLSPSSRQIFPLGPSKTLCLHWPMADPSTLPDAEAGPAMAAAWHELEQRLHPLLEGVRRD